MLLLERDITFDGASQVLTFQLKSNNKRKIEIEELRSRMVTAGDLTTIITSCDHVGYGFSARRVDWMQRFDDRAK